MIAVATLIVGSLLGALMFAVINFPSALGISAADWKATIAGAYLLNPLNACFAITVICAAVMLAVSHATGSKQQDLAKADTVHRSTKIEKMTPRETRIYRTTLAVFAAIWIAVLLLFAPLGIGRTKPDASTANSGAPAENAALRSSNFFEPGSPNLRANISGLIIPAGRGELRAKTLKGYLK